MDVFSIVDSRGRFSDKVETSDSMLVAA